MKNPEDEHTYDGIKREKLFLKNRYKYLLYQKTNRKKPVTCNIYQVITFQ